MKEILTSTTFYLEKNITDSFNFEPYHSNDGKGNSHYLHLPYLETCYEIRQNTWEITCGMKVKFSQGQL